MSEPQLHLVSRTEKPYTKAKAALKDGYIPGILYGKGIEPQSFLANESDLLKLFAVYGTKRKISITLNDVNSSAIVKDYQKDRLKNRFIHIDLQALNENETIKVSSSIQIVNREVVEQADRILQIQTHEVDIQVFPRHIPESVTVDASLLLDKDSLTLADLNIVGDKNIEILNDLDTVVATLTYVQRDVPETTNDSDNESTDVQEEPKVDSQGS